MSYKGKINTYTCPKGHVTVTIDREDGVTPMMLGCRQKDDDGKHNCTETAQSGWYNVDQSLDPEYEWFRPTDLKKLNTSEREHVKKGGLLIRKISKTTVL